MIYKQPAAIADETDATDAHNSTSGKKPFKLPYDQVYKEKKKREAPSHRKNNKKVKRDEKNVDSVRGNGLDTLIVYGIPLKIYASKSLQLEFFETFKKLGAIRSIDYKRIVSFSITCDMNIYPFVAGGARH